jgi:DNA polymerase III subunit gamma/tau
MQAPPEPAPEPSPEPMATGDWRQRLHAALMELNMPFTADAVENSRVAESNGELQFTTSAAYKLALRPDDLNKALKQITSKPYRIKVTVGDAGSQAAPLTSAPKASAPPADDDATARALANPEVQRFREVFGGEIRKVRNLKE